MNGSCGQNSFCATVSVLYDERKSDIKERLRYVYKVTVPHFSTILFWSVKSLEQKTF